MESELQHSVTRHAGFQLQASACSNNIKKLLISNKVCIFILGTLFAWVVFGNWPHLSFTKLMFLYT